MSLHHHFERLVQVAKALQSPVRIDFACNDPDNGLFAGRIAQIEMGDLLSLEARHWNGTSFHKCPRLRHERSSIIVSGKRWPITRSKEWVGNWCWNAYWMEAVVNWQFVVWLRRRDLFRAVEGPADLFDAWNHPDWQVLERKLDPANTVEFLKRHHE